MQLIAVVLNDYDMFADCMRLLDYGFENYEWTDVTGEKRLDDALAVNNGIKSTADVKLDGEIYLPLSKNDSKIEINYKLHNGINAPVHEGDEVGSAQYILNGEVLRQTPIFAAESVEENTYSYRLERILRAWLGIGKA